MSAVNEKILEKVRKLLALSGSSNVQEAQAALTKANKLMEEHNLTMSEVEVRETEYIQSGWMDFLTSVKQEWELHLGIAIGRLFDCKTLTSPGGRGNRKPRISYFGTKLDTQVAEFTFDSLRNRIQQMAFEETGKYTQSFKNKYGVTPRYESGAIHPKTWRTNWINGVVHGIHLQVDQILKSRKTQESSAYAIVSFKDQRLEEEIRIKMPSLRTIESLSSRPSNPHAHNQGYGVGLAIDIQKGVTS